MGPGAASLEGRSRSLAAAARLTRKRPRGDAAGAPAGAPWRGEVGARERARRMPAPGWRALGLSPRARAGELCHPGGPAQLGDHPACAWRTLVPHIAARGVCQLLQT